MKKTTYIIGYFAIILLLLSACSSSHRNELIYRYTKTASAVPFDSLKTAILEDPGTDMMVVYPDSDVVIIQYDRFKTHQDIIETHFKSCGYDVTLVEKNKIEKTNQPWQKK